MKRIITRIPAGLTLDQLDPEQRDAIERVFTQYVIMPGTTAYNNQEIVDGIVGDNFELTAITDLGLPFEVLGIWQWDGQSSTLTSLMEFNQAEFYFHLPRMIETDIDGNIISDEPATLHIPHNWAGWPKIII